MLHDLPLILGTAAAVASACAAAGLWIVRSIVAEDIRPIRETVVELRTVMDALARALAKTDHDAADVATRMERLVRELRDEVRTATHAIEAVLADHGERLAAIETTIVAHHPDTAPGKRPATKRR